VPRICVPVSDGSDTTTAPTSSVSSRNAGVCLIKEGASSDGTPTTLPQRCVPCPADASQQGVTSATAGLEALESLRRVCAALDPSQDTVDEDGTAVQQSDTSAGTRQVLLCPGDNGSYRPCAPCPTSQRQAGGVIVPLCLLNGDTTYSPDTSGQDLSGATRSPYTTPDRASTPDTIPYGSPSDDGRPSAWQDNS
jgi:hypothetical protein